MDMLFDCIGLFAPAPFVTGRRKVMIRLSFGANVKDVIAFNSVFVSWCCSGFGVFCASAYSGGSARMQIANNNRLTGDDRYIFTNIADPL